MFSWKSLTLAATLFAVPSLAYAGNCGCEDCACKDCKAGECDSKCDCKSSKHDCGCHKNEKK